MGHSAQGSVRVQRVREGEPGKDGTDAVVWRIEPSAAAVKKNADGTVSDYITVTGYKTVGKVTTKYDFLAQMEGEPKVSAQYSIDGGGWTSCDKLREANTVKIIAIGVTAAHLAAVTKGVQFRMLEDGTEVARSATLPVVKDGTDGADGSPGIHGSRGPAIRGPQDWEGLADGYAFESGAEGESYIDIVVWNDDYYVCKTSHTKSVEDGNWPTSEISNEDTLWGAANQMDFVATKLLLAERAKIKNLYVEEVETVDSNGNSSVHISGGIITVGKHGSTPNIRFGLDESGMAVLRYYDNAGNLLYDLGPNGLRKLEVTAERWGEFELAGVCDTVEEITEDIAAWAYPDIPTAVATYYRYISGTLNGEPTDTAHNNKVYYAKNYNSKGLTGWLMTVEAAMVHSRKQGQTEWAVPLPADMTEANEAILVTQNATVLYYRTLYHYTNGINDAVQNYYFTDKMI